MPNQVKKDEQLADEPTLQTFADKPIQTFGLSLLKNMGFSQSRGIGYNKKNILLKPLQLKPRPKGLGLGANPQDYLFFLGEYIQIFNQPHQGMLDCAKSVNQDIITIQFQVSGAEKKLINSKNEMLKQEGQQKKEEQKIIREKT